MEARSLLAAFGLRQRNRVDLLSAARRAAAAAVVVELSLRARLQGGVLCGRDGVRNVG